MGAPNLDVGRYAAFVWPAYGISALTLLALTVDSLLRAARWRREAERPETGRQKAGRPATERREAR